MNIQRNSAKEWDLSVLLPLPDELRLQVRMGVHIRNWKKYRSILHVRQEIFCIVSKIGQEEVYSSNPTVNDHIRQAPRVFSDKMDSKNLEEFSLPSSFAYCRSK